ncbi:AlpA family phage regulatory protein [Gemmata sp. JC673]|uniref:AlpA family phage regulatory protein n=1 Tax=Gemmata algarum TaxID=2975278 RepID=A0ABU5ETP7_9BACT|nr:AlpA family phage regulatory protein [Gemmata algarum]MDY3558624.1 AlpA family phage regulatory protein [Gemmata algarum]
MKATTETPDRPRPRRRLLPGLLRRERAARYCGVGESTWDRLTAAGRTPAPIRLGGSVGWARRELDRWIEHGCPPRAEWEPVWQALRANRSGARPR